ncbi:rho guanine nucleotide exchange factor 17-like [Oppia nitens]|uniref:rho guanine nucleotide exchange factor 17-like n=1 Tax=Oppia nitens TaxID=1686743 RepID=UPI0023DC1FBD|nr:rho guanine nucleotide exchange factor 17-like [Oppia nitens]
MHSMALSLRPIDRLDSSETRFARASTLSLHACVSLQRLTALEIGKALQLFVCFYFLSHLLTTRVHVTPVGGRRSAVVRASSETSVVTQCESRGASAHIFGSFVWIFAKKESKIERKMRTTDERVNDAKLNNDVSPQRSSHTPLTHSSVDHRLAFRHLGDEWQQICATLLSCEQLLTVMSGDRHPIDDDCPDDALERQHLRQIIRQIEPQKYVKSGHRRHHSCSRRSSYHRLKALTQLLMTSSLKRSTSLQSVAVVPNDVMNDTTATLPRFRRRPRIQRVFRSLDVSDDNSDETNHKTADRSGLSLVLSPTTRSPDSETSDCSRTNRHSCDVTSLLLSPSTPSPATVAVANGRQILKYSKKRLRGPYGEMLESRMSRCAQEDQKHLSFVQELLRETQEQRIQLDKNAKETTGTAKEDRIQTQSDAMAAEPSITATIGRHLDTRTHIVGELYDTEKSFCEQLRHLLEKYSKPLTESLIIDVVFVDVIFGRIPAILAIHSRFLEELRRRIADWTPESRTVGDLFGLFDEPVCRETYLSFVDNWTQSKQLVKSLLRDKPSFGRFLTDASREHRSKLSLDELMIAVIQRIPRFELLLKQLLKNTQESHPDHCLLAQALSKIHSLVLHINRVRDADATSGTTAGHQLDVGFGTTLSLSQLESICDGLPTALLSSATLVDAAFVWIRKRERIVVLFSSLLVILSVKGKKKSQKFDENKYKVLNYFAIESIDDSADVRDDADEEGVDALEKDAQILRSIQTSFVARLSSYSRNSLDGFLQDMSQSLTKKMAQLKNQEKNLELLVSGPSSGTTTETSSGTTTQGVTIVLTFATQEKRQQFQQMLREVKSASKPSKSRVPHFACFLPIRKTRAGLQFTCAAPTIGTNDVWICNSDGFVGQISVLSLTCDSREPTVVSCNGVCNSRITCLTCVPSLISQTTDESDVSDSDGTNDSATHPTNALASATMWFGTDDASVHIYSTSDAIRIKKNKVKVALNSKVLSIAFFGEKVIVSLDNHSIAIFSRDLNGCWITEPEIRLGMHCEHLLVVDLRLWTSGHSRQLVVRDVDLNSVAELLVDVSDDDFVSAMTTSAELRRVFVSTHESLQVHVFDACEPFSRVQVVNVQWALQRALLVCEDIIRQHKSACLRVSCLLAAKDSVWIGTSAGIICLLDGQDCDLEIVPNGHTGHVRFLTSTCISGRHLVISGGDGLETYGRLNSTTDGVVMNATIGGNEDSTSHLLLWDLSLE